VDAIFHAWNDRRPPGPAEWPVGQEFGYPAGPVVEVSSVSIAGGFTRVWKTVQ
jgi:hypothetical protein